METYDGGVVSRALPLDFTDVGEVAQTIFNAVTNKQYSLVASLAVVLLVLGARKFAPNSSGFGIWLNSRIGAIVSNFVLSFGGAIATTAAAGEPFSFKILLQALIVALTAAGGWAIFKNVSDDLAEKKAQREGTTIAEDPSKVEETLNK